MSDISELFQRDPLSLTREDRSKIIAKYRDDRACYLMGQKPAKAAKAKALPKGGLNLDDIEDAEFAEVKALPAPKGLSLDDLED